MKLARIKSCWCPGPSEIIYFGRGDVVARYHNLFLGLWSAFEAKMTIWLSSHWAISIARLGKFFFSLGKFDQITPLGHDFEAILNTRILHKGFSNEDLKLI